MPIIQDRQEIRINSVSSDGKPPRRSESGEKTRLVTLYSHEVPDLPPAMKEQERMGRRLMFAPEKVVITYRLGVRDEDGFAFDEVRVIGPNIRKDGSHGELAGDVRYWVMPEQDMSEERLLRAGEYIIPDYLAELVTLYDPTGEAHPFTATKDEVLA